MSSDTKRLEDEAMKAVKAVRRIWKKNPLDTVPEWSRRTAWIDGLGLDRLQLEIDEQSTRDGITG